jgi:FHA domain
MVEVLPLEKVADGYQRYGNQPGPLPRGAHHRALSANAGARFLLDQAITTAGCHPNSDIFLDDITVSRRHAQFRCERRIPGYRRRQPHRHLCQP